MIINFLNENVTINYFITDFLINKLTKYKT